MLVQQLGEAIVGPRLYPGKAGPPGDPQEQSDTLWDSDVVVLGGLNGSPELVVAANGDVIYSRYRHDYRHSPDGSVWIDGGRDYTRSGVPTGEWDAFVTLRIVEDKLIIVED